MRRDIIEQAIKDMEKIEYLHKDYIQGDLTKEEKKILENLIGIVNIGGAGLAKALSCLTDLKFSLKTDLMLYLFKNLSKKEIEQISIAYKKDRAVQALAFVGEELLGIKPDDIK